MDTPTPAPIPDLARFQTLIASLPDAHSFSLLALLQTANYAWLTDEADHYATDTNAGAVAKNVLNDFPSDFKTVFSKGNSLDLAIQTIKENASSYPAPFTGSNSPFPEILSKLTTAYTAFINADMSAAISDTSFKTSQPIISSLIDYSSALYQLEVFFHSTMSAIKQNSEKKCPEFPAMLTVLEALPRFNHIQWAYYYLIATSQFICTHSLPSFTTISSSTQTFMKNLFPKDGSIETAMNTAADNIDKFSSCYAEDQILLPPLVKNYSDLKSGGTDYLTVYCDYPSVTYSVFLYPDGWAPYKNFMSAIEPICDAYLLPCYAHETCTPKPKPLPTPHFEDMIKMFNTLIYAASASAVFEALNTTSQWVAREFNPVQSPQVAKIGQSFLGDIFTSSTATSMKNLFENVTDLPAAVQKDIKTLNGYYQTIYSLMSTQDTSFAAQIPSFTAALKPYAKLLAEIRNNYFSVIFVDKNEG